MTEEERKNYLKYIENYTINDLADIFNTQNFVIHDKDKFNEILLYYHFKQNEEIEQLQQENKKYKNQQKEFIEYLENEKDRLARECSPTYEYSLGKTKLVSEDIFNEVDKIISKYEEIIDKLESGEQ